MALLEDLDALRAAAAVAFEAAGGPAALESSRVEFLGNRGKLKALLGRMGEVSREQKPAVGKRANEVGAEIQALFDAAKARVETATSAATPATGGADHAGDSLRQERLTKLARYEEKMGKGAGWGSRFPDPRSGKSLTPINEIRKKFPALAEGEAPNGETRFGTVLLAARLMLRRDQSKKLIFLTVQDQTGSIQVALWNNLLNEDTLSLLRDTLDLWDIVGIEGELGYTQKGEPTVWASSARILTKCIAPPPDKHHGIHDKEIRYRQRYLDLITTPESSKRFILRAKAIAGLRRFLDDQGFLEMETPVLQTIPGGASARPFETRLNSLDMKMYLRIATEIPLKKLLVGGLEKVYELGRIFRNEGISMRHNPEFTTVELYQAYGDLRDMMAITENSISKLALDLTGSTTVTWRGNPIKLGAPWPRLDYCELLLKHAGVGHEDVPGLELKLKEKGIDPAGLSHVEKIDGVFGEYAETHLRDACFIVNQPLEMSPLCRAHPANPKLADRFEAFAAGMELANAYTELNDPIEQRRRLCMQLAEAWAKFHSTVTSEGLSSLFTSEIEAARAKQSVEIAADQMWYPKAADLGLLEKIRAAFAPHALKGDAKTQKKMQIQLEQIEKLIDPSNSLDEDFLCSLEHGMPPAGGLGIGIDRVVMLLAGADSIRDVILFPLMRPVHENPVPAAAAVQPPK